MLTTLTVLKSEQLIIEALKLKAKEQHAPS
jgi:hypothetical protein